MSKQSKTPRMASWLQRWSKRCWRRPWWSVRRRLVVAAASLVSLLFAAATARLFVWPELPPLPSRADAIIELAGPGERDALALELARAHRAPLLVQSTVIEEQRSGHCLPPVPGVTILCFHPDPNTTRGEARYIGRLARQRHWTSVILVTTRDHAWRARLRVARCFDGQIYVSTSPMPRFGWLTGIPHQWAGTAKAFTTERSC